VGRLIGLLLLVVACSPTAPPASSSSEPAPSYDRADWGRWADADGDCQDTRQEVLIAESLRPVEFADARRCRVSKGLWHCPYTWLLVEDPSELDIDHVVALHEAHELGGFRWSPEQKNAYFNDLENPDHLVAVVASANRSKGSRPPSEWLPFGEEQRCAYLKARLSVLKRYALSYDCSEYLQLMEKHCK